MPAECTLGRPKNARVGRQKYLVRVSGRCSRQTTTMHWPANPSICAVASGTIGADRVVAYGRLRKKRLGEGRGRGLSGQPDCNARQTCATHTATLLRVITMPAECTL